MCSIAENPLNPMLVARVFIRIVIDNIAIIFLLLPYFSIVVGTSSNYFFCLFCTFFYSHLYTLATEFQPSRRPQNGLPNSSPSAVATRSLSKRKAVRFVKLKGLEV